MSVEIVKVMEKDDKGNIRQKYPETHIEAILGLDPENSGLLSAADKKVIDRLSKIKFEKVGEI